MQLRAVVMTGLMLVSLPALAEQEAAPRNAPYSGFSDEFFYSGGRMTGNQSVYKNLPQQEVQKPSNDKPHEWNNGQYRRHAFPRNPGEGSMYSPPVSFYGFLSPGFLSMCQAEVQDAINQKNLRNDEIYFSGSPTRGQAVDGQRQRYNYACENGDVYIW